MLTTLRNFWLHPVNTLREIWSYREMIAGLVHRDLRGRYKGSMLGFLWTFINPFLQLMVYTMVFSVIMRSGIDKYYLFLFVALIPWMFFSTSVAGGCNCVLDQTGMVTKIYFPREVLPIAHVTASFINMLYCFIVVLAVVLLSGVTINPLALLCLPLVMIVEYFLALGFALLFSALTVYLRDLAHIMGIVVMAWQFLTPVMYDISAVPEAMRQIFYLNPMTSVIMAYRDILYAGVVPDLSTLGTAVAAALIFLVLGFEVFGRLKRGFAEQL